ncbi:MAG: hypothetical protein J6J16_09735 [Lachnospiraceae bacterium]|nr:hypothetical protein [Lachnospiraceae bacterium]
MQTYCRNYYNPDYRIEYKGTEYSVMVSAYGEGWYTPGTMYRSNGDPGDPPDGDWEIKEIDILQIRYWVEGDVNDWIFVQGSPEEIKELEKALSNIIEEELEEDDFKDPESILPEHEEEDW